MHLHSNKIMLLRVLEKDREVNINDQEDDMGHAFDDALRMFSGLQLVGNYAAYASYHAGKFCAAVFYVFREQEGGFGPCKLFYTFVFQECHNQLVCIGRDVSYDGGPGRVFALDIRILGVYRHKVLSIFPQWISVGVVLRDIGPESSPQLRVELWRGRGAHSIIVVTQDYSVQVRVFSSDRFPVVKRKLKPIPILGQCSNIMTRGYSNFQ